MKTKKFFYVFLAAVLFAFISCNQNDDDGGEVIDYPFETILGSWTRTGKIGVMGVAKLKVYKDKNDDTITLMDFKSDLISQTYKCYVTKQSPAVYEVVWKTFDKATKTEGSEEPIIVTMTIEGKNELYLITAKMSGMHMKRD